MLLLERAGVPDDLLDHLEIHERFAAEEVHLEVVATAGVLDEVIDRRLPHFQGHQLAVAHIFARVREAVFAPQVAVVRDM